VFYIGKNFPIYHQALHRFRPAINGLYRSFPLPYKEKLDHLFWCPYDNSNYLKGQLNRSVQDELPKASIADLNYSL